MAPSRRGRNHAKLICLVGEIAKKKKDEKKRKIEEMHQERVNQMTKSAEGSAGLLLTFTKPTAWRGAQILTKEEEEWAKHWQRDESVQNMEDKPVKTRS